MHAITPSGGRTYRLRPSAPLNRHWTRTVAATAASLSIACASAPRNPVLDKYPAGVSGRTTVLYYDVHGRTFEELRADMRRLGPKIDGSTYVGETRSPMQWNWRTESNGGATCTIRDVTVLVNAQITLPRWSPPPDTEPGLAAEWKRFLTALETHEAGHKDISARAASEIIDRLRGVSGLCSQLGTRANDLARVIVERARQEQTTYDAVTRHGFTQGTSFGAGRFRATTVADSGRLLVALRPGAVHEALSVPLERTWTAIPAAYAAIDLAVNMVDSSAHAVGDSVTVRGTVGKVSVSELLDCGTPPAGQHADPVDFVLLVRTRLAVNEPAGTMVTNSVQAVARYPGAFPIACRSRGVLERRLFDALRSELAR